MPSGARWRRCSNEISPGGLIVFDDYGWMCYRPQKDAADAFMEARGLSVPGIADRPGAGGEAVVAEGNPFDTSEEGPYHPS